MLLRAAETIDSLRHLNYQKSLQHTHTRTLRKRKEHTAIRQIDINIAHRKRVAYDNNSQHNKLFQSLYIVHNNAVRYHLFKKDESTYFLNISRDYFVLSIATLLSNHYILLGHFIKLSSKTIIIIMIIINKKNT